jgi:Uma2 family endonuclease
MPETVAPPEQRMLLHNVSWETYEHLLADHAESPGTRFAYDDGELEIMVVSIGHEGVNLELAALAGVVADETDKDLTLAGSTTLKRQDLAKGVEPDSSFYIEHAGLFRDKAELELPADPPPDLVIEVDITSSSLDRFPIFAALGVTEIWRYHNERVRMYTLDRDRYQEIEGSGVLPPLTAQRATEFLLERRRMRRSAWLRSIREWIHANR